MEATEAFLYKAIPTMINSIIMQTNAASTFRFLAMIYQ